MPRKSRHDSNFKLAPNLNQINYREIILLLLIFAFFAFTRFYNLDKRIFFDWDQEQFTNQIKQIVVDHRPVLLGPRTTSEKGFFLAPYFTYLLIPFYLLTNLHPSALVYFVIVFDCFFFFLSYFLLKKTFSQKIALWFLILWTPNFMMVGYDTSPWWPITVPLGVLVVVYFLKLVSDQPKKDNHYIFLGLLSGLFLNMHFQFIFIMFFITLFLLINRRTSIKQALIGIFSFLITLTPLLIFDLRHQFLNTNLFLGFFSKGIDNAPFQPTAWLPVFTNFIEPFIPLKNIYLTGLFYIVILAASVFLFQKSIGFKKNFYLSFIILYLLFPFVFTKYGRRPSEYYFIFLYPFIYIAIADFFILLKKEFFLALIIFYLVLADLRPIKDQLRSNPYGLYYKDRLIQKLAGQIRGQRFNITFSVPPGANHGYRYLFDYYQIKQTGDWHDPIVQIRIPPNKESTYVSEAKALSFIIPKELR